MTIAAAGTRLYIQRKDLHQTRFGPDPDATTTLADGQARLALEHFALTANNITYAAFGEAMKYWQFFPAPDPDWGCLPVWGFATVTESRAAGVAVGQRVYGYFPAGTHLVVTPSRVHAAGFADGAAHRQELAAVYQHYQFCDRDPSWQARLEGLQAVLKPLFVTSFLIDDFLADNQFFGARQLLLSSASSKTAYGTAFCLAQRRGSPDLPRIVGLTSPGNLGFAQSLGCYDEVRPYTDVANMDPALPTVYVDFAGDAALRRQVHETFGGALKFSSSIGGTHWEAIGSAGGLPGPRPTLFFAPAQIKTRSAAPPEGWGRDELDRRIAQAWSAFIARVERSDDPWLKVVQGSGSKATEAAYRALLDGRANPREGLMLSLQE
ncbi:MAG: DUF2855 family protein [Rubrivivax sp.]|nr:DUF2855 family protein [Rubrivivax sp.]MBK7260425.1 DUF2855 family protein [Rubrivivax sp.]MBK8526101.1 DUF2855 family protein [Rubrivivax sp.]